MVSITSDTTRVHTAGFTLQGGVKLLAKIMRSFMGVDGNALTLAARVLHKCCLASPLMQQSLIKEKVWAWGGNASPLPSCNRASSRRRCKLGRDESKC